MNIQPIRDNLLVFYPNGEKDDVINYGSLKLIKDVRFEPTFSIKDSAVAAFVSDKIGIPQGAIVYVSYTVAADGNEPYLVDENGKFFKAKKSDVFLYEHEDVIDAVNHWVIVEAVVEEQFITLTSGIVLPNEKARGNEKYGRVRYINKETSEATDLKIGDKVMLAENAHYKFKFHDEDLYRVDSNLSILAKDV